MLKTTEGKPPLNLEASNGPTKVNTPVIVRNTPNEPNRWRASRMPRRPAVNVAIGIAAATQYSDVRVSDRSASGAFRIEWASIPEPAAKIAPPAQPKARISVNAVHTVLASSESSGEPGSAPKPSATSRVNARPNPKSNRLQ